MSSTRTMGVAVTDVSTTQQLPLGFEYTEPADATNNYGDRTWVYVFNDDGSTAFAAGHIIMRDAGTTTYDGVPTTAGTLISTLRLLGVAQHAIAGGSYGFILKRGMGEVMAGDGAVIGANTALTSAGTSTAGTALDFAAGTTAPDCVFAFSTEASTGTNGLATCMINCLG
jgi:hypothetical protein